MNVLALDLAARTGVAFRRCDGQLSVREWNLGRGISTVARSPIPMVRLWNRLNRLNNLCRIDAMVLEQTYGTGDSGNHLNRLETTAQLFACLNGMRWMRVFPSTWKKKIVGNGRANHAEYLAFARERWGDVRTDNEAAALCLLDYWDFASELDVLGGEE